MHSDELTGEAAAIWSRRNGDMLQVATSMWEPAALTQLRSEGATLRVLPRFRQAVERYNENTRTLYRQEGAEPPAAELLSMPTLADLRRLLPACRRYAVGGRDSRGYPAR